jgi:predicted nuclease of predicted toxin-antitoxin system
MKFLADMGISPKTVDFLQGLGHHAVHLQQQGFHRLKDSLILEHARKEGYIVLTHDLDFGDLLAASGADLPSVVTFRLRNMRPENVNSYLFKIVSQYPEALGSGAIITVTEGRIRIRELPVGNRNQPKE